MEETTATFLENFRQCCLASCARLSVRMERQDAAYQAVSQNCEALYRQIEEKLGADHRLINRFDAAKNGELSFSQEYVYQQGFRDCAALLRWLGLF